MLYYLFEYFDQLYDFPGSGLFQYISFRASLAIITSLLVSLVFGGKIINLIQRKQIGEQVRNLGLEGESSKTGTPTMGGLIILSAILIPTLLFAKLDNIYIIIMIVSTFWLGIIGFIDDYIKVFKKDKEGLAGRFKILGQVGIGILVGLVMVFHNDIVVKDAVNLSPEIEQSELLPHKSSRTTTPFFKNNEFDYQLLTSWIGEKGKDYAWILFVFIVVILLLQFLMELI